jgi:hypothetical protein
MAPTCPTIAIGSLSLPVTVFSNPYCHPELAVMPLPAQITAHHTALRPLQAGGNNTVTCDWKWSKSIQV